MSPPRHWESRGGARRISRVGLPRAGKKPSGRRSRKYREAAANRGRENRNPLPARNPPVLPSGTSGDKRFLDFSFPILQTGFLRERERTVLKCARRNSRDEIWRGAISRF